jgi:hypothetical protein
MRIPKFFYKYRLQKHIRRAIRDTEIFQHRYAIALQDEDLDDIEVILETLRTLQHIITTNPNERTHRN